MVYNAYEYSPEVLPQNIPILFKKESTETKYHIVYIKRNGDEYYS